MGLGGASRTGKRRYAPKLEALEALRMLDAGAMGLVPSVAEHGAVLDSVVPGSSAPVVGWPGLAAASPATGVSGSSAWDEALSQTLEDDWLDQLGEPSSAAVATLPSLDRAATLVDSDSLAAGLQHLNRYLGRAWGRAGIPGSQQEDCTQAVHATMLEELGRPAFDQMLADIGRSSVPQVLNRDSALGPDFFRAVDMIKKRAIRQRTFLALEDQPEPSACMAGGDGAETWRGALNEAIERTLSPREANLVRATLEGFSPAEIGERLGLASKTVSNEKTRVFAKLRSALEAELAA